MPSGGSREIEAAKHRLAAAKMQASATAKTMESAKATSDAARNMAEKAKSMMEVAIAAKESAEIMADFSNNTMDAAQSQLDSSQKEVGEAEIFLAEAEQRWEVIDVDGDAKVESQESDEHSKKRRKVSLSPSSAASAPIDESNDFTPIVLDFDAVVAPVAAATSVGAAVQSVNTTAHGATGQAENNEGGDSNTNNTLDQKIIIVEGAGTPEVNGTYKLAAHRKYSGVQVYCKRGEWKRQKNVEFALFYRIGFWYIGVGKVNMYPSTRLYKTVNRVLNLGRVLDTPVNMGWKAVNGAKDPAPQLRFAAISDDDDDNSVKSVDVIVVEGCGLSEVNGNYKKAEGDQHGRATYKKGGRWKGKMGAKFVLWQYYDLYGVTKWSIMHVGSQAATTYLYTAASPPGENVDLPPKSGWRIEMEGIAPGPMLKW